MTKYIFLKNYHAKGSNYVPPGSMMASRLVEKDFKLGDIVEGEVIENKPTGKEDLTIVRLAAPTLRLMDADKSIVFTMPVLMNTTVSVYKPLNETKPGNWFTNMSGLNKAALIIAVVIGGFFTLKHFKVIK